MSTPTAKLSQHIISSTNKRSVKNNSINENDVSIYSTPDKDWSKLNHFKAWKLKKCHSIDTSNILHTKRTTAKRVIYKSQQNKI